MSIKVDITNVELEDIYGDGELSVVIKGRTSTICNMCGHAVSLYIEPEISKFFYDDVDDIPYDELVYQVVEFLYHPPKGFNHTKKGIPNKNGKIEFQEVHICDECFRLISDEENSNKLKKLMTLLVK